MIPDYMWFYYFYKKISFSVEIRNCELVLLTYLHSFPGSDLIKWLFVNMIYVCKYKMYTRITIFKNISAWKPNNFKLDLLKIKCDLEIKHSVRTVL